MTPLTADDRQAFLAAIMAAPDDPYPRLVFADWLAERGDVAGERAQRLGAVIADPDSDRLRLDFADWLQDHSEPDRAELIRVQVELARRHFGCTPACSAEYGHGRGCTLAAGDALRRRERELLFAIPGSAWLGDWEPNPDRTTYPMRPAYHGRPAVMICRGFPAAVTLDWPAACAHLDAVLDAAPVTEVTLSDWPAFETRGDASELRLHGRPRWHRVPLSSSIPPGVTREYVARKLLAAEWPRIRAESWHLPPAPHAGGVSYPAREAFERVRAARR